jgi:hypothetical protein
MVVSKRFDFQVKRLRVILREVLEAGVKVCRIPEMGEGILCAQGCSGDRELRFRQAAFRC